MSDHAYGVATTLPGSTITPTELGIGADSGTIQVAHGGSGAPSSILVVLRCKSAEGGYAVGDEVVWKNDRGDASREVSPAANGTYVWVSYLGASLTPAIRNTSGTLIAVTASKWRVVLKCLWV